LKRKQSLKNGWIHLRNDKNERELKNYIWENVKQITIKGGFELYNKLANAIERGEIADLEELKKRI
jgi:hypothetical protein